MPNNSYIFLSFDTSIIFMCVAKIRPIFILPRKTEQLIYFFLGISYWLHNCIHCDSSSNAIDSKIMSNNIDQDSDNQCTSTLGYHISSPFLDQNNHCICIFLDFRTQARMTRDSCYTCKMSRKNS